MTAIWGPLGWMTLHSVATSYPEQPTPSEKALMNSWLDMFADTITCPHCQQHFKDMLANYRARFPNMLASRQTFSMFTFRAHNAVNRRLNKPMYSTLDECMETLRNNIKSRSAADYRVAYINHITRYWRTLQDINGIVAIKKINEMKKIEMEYIMSRDTKFQITLQPDVVVLPRDVLEPNAEPPRMNMPRIPRMPLNVSAGFRIGPGGLQLRR